MHDYLVGILTFKREEYTELNDDVKTRKAGNVELEDYDTKYSQNDYNTNLMDRVV